MGRSRDDQRSSSFVNQDVVNFVDDGKIKFALGLLLVFRVTLISLCCRTHVIAKVIKTEFVVGAISDVTGIGRLPFVHVHVALDRPDS